LGAETRRRQLIARPERAVEEHGVHAGERLADVVGDGADPAEIGEQPAAARLANPEAHAVFGIRRPRSLEMHRRFSWKNYRLGGEAGRPSVDAEDLLLKAGLHAPPRHLPGETLERTVEDVVLREAALDGLRGVNDERMGLAQRQEPEAVIQVAVREEDGRDR